ncbi:FAD-dependent oxidoreductase [Paucibacter sp. O1-1]|nr:FAD-dependent oxidoreductase [Paucibacter sp. O1-1]MDA3829980.1 FAD-dependent oxidoreductase [Paucibacter sp. O1-1]
MLAFDKLGLVDKLRYALHVMKTKSVSDWRELDKVLIIPWLKKSIGERAYKALWERLFHLKFYEYKDCTSPRPGLNPHQARRPVTPQSAAGVVRLHRGRLETLLDRMEQYIRQRGGRLHLRGIDQVTTSGGKVRGAAVRGVEQAVDGVISTAPIQYVPQARARPAGRFRRAASSAIENIPVVCVILKLKQPLSREFLDEHPRRAASRFPASSSTRIRTRRPATRSSTRRSTCPRRIRSTPATTPAFIEETSRLPAAHQPGIPPRLGAAPRTVHRYEFAQAVCPPGFYAMLPPMQYAHRRASAWPTPPTTTRRTGPFCESVKVAGATSSLLPCRRIP